MNPNNADLPTADPNVHTEPPSAASRRWEELLAHVPDRDAWLAAQPKAQQDIGLVHDGEPVVTVARPELLAAADVARDQAVVDAVSAGLIAAGNLLLDKPDLEQRYFGDWLHEHGLAELVRLDTGTPDQIVHGRFDGVRGPDGLRLLEFNGGLPGGAMPADAGANYLASWPFFDEFTAEYSVTLPTVRADLVRAWISTWHQFGGSGTPTLVVALPDELRALALPSIAHFESVIADAGLQLHIVDPGKLEFSGSRLRLDGEPVDLVLRAFFTSMLTALGQRVSGLLDALRAGAVCMVSSFKAGMYGHKGLFAVLTDPQIDLGLSEEQRSLINGHMPWTRMAEDTEVVTPQGQPVPLHEFVMDHRESLVLKPVAGFGGAGVLLGWEQQADQWASAFIQAVAHGGFIVQERVPLTMADLPGLEPGLPRRQLNLDHNPVVAGGQISGYFVRASAGGITNVTGGAGSVVPSLTLD